MYDAIFCSVGSGSLRHQEVLHIMDTLPVGVNHVNVRIRGICRCVDSLQDLHVTGTRCAAFFTYIFSYLLVSKTRLYPSHM